ncbi:hypothetical protein BH10ACI1_BH10ACI1_13160 [soil metagenome]
MIIDALLIDLSPVSSPIRIFLGIAFFFICLMAAYIAFKMLKKTVKMAIRMTIVAVILIFGLILTIGFFLFGGANKISEKESPIPTQTQRKAR